MKTPTRKFRGGTCTPLLAHCPSYQAGRWSYYAAPLPHWGQHPKALNLHHSSGREGGQGEPGGGSSMSARYSLGSLNALLVSFSIHWKAVQQIETEGNLQSASSLPQMLAISGAGPETPSWYPSCMSGIQPWASICSLAGHLAGPGSRAKAQGLSHCEFLERNFAQ